MARRRRRGPPRCRDCNAPVVFFRSPSTGTWRPFAPRPVDPSQQHPGPAYPVEGNVWAWPYRDLVEDLMVRHRYSQAEAEDEAHDLPWHIPHDCPNRRQEATR